MIPRYPLQWPAGWPRSTNRAEGKFGSTEQKFSETGGSWREKKDLTTHKALDRVHYELGRLGVEEGDFIVSTNLRVRLDGRPAADQREPEDPGAAVYWQFPGEPMKVMAIDRYSRVRDNLAAIAATLEAMRAIERHGGGQILERAFTGFDALPPPKSCWEILGIARGSSRERIEKAFRDLAKRHHPDVGGNVVEFHAIQNARDEALRA